MSFKRNVSFPDNLNNVKELTSSPSLDSFLNIPNTTIIEFEGDGQLGIYFQIINSDIIVYNIKKGTVADEYYELELDMKLLRVNSFLVENFTFMKIIKLIDKIWSKNNIIELEFLKLKNPVLNLLENIKMDKYYSIFKELGAKTLDDIEFIEYYDLMNIPYIDRNKICQKLNINIPEQ